MKSARNILFISETITFLLIYYFLIFFILYFLQMHLKSGYISIARKHDIGKVENVN
jgi:hypothetical protein